MMEDTHRRGVPRSAIDFARRRRVFLVVHDMLTEQCTPSGNDTRRPGRSRRWTGVTASCRPMVSRLPWIYSKDAFIRDAAPASLSHAKALAIARAFAAFANNRK